MTPRSRARCGIIVCVVLLVFFCDLFYTRVTISCELVRLMLVQDLLSRPSHVSFR
jgi:hypothetical protein